MKYFSSFSGIGAFEYTINELGLNRECIGFSEIDKYAIQTYTKHYPSHNIFGDITKIDTNNLPNFSILLGGSPCQSFSDTGKKKGFEDYRGNLFFDYIRILKNKQPNFFIFENVRGILTNNKGKTFKTIINEFNKAGYNTKRKILNSKDFGGNQNRPRIFIVGQKKSLGEFNFEFPIGINKKGKLKDILEKDVSEKYKVSDKQIRSWYSTNFHSHKSQFLNKTCCCLTVGGNQKRIIINKSDDFIKKYYNKQLNENELTGIEGRKLTPGEYEKLQGFSLGYTDINLSDTQKYKQISNSISIHVLKELLTKFDLYIKNKMQKN